jgi:hypothetical protein
VLVLSLHVKRILYIWQAPRIQPSPMFIIVTGVIINVHVYKHSLWAHVVFVVAQNNGTISFPSPQNTHSNTLSYCLVALHHTLKLTRASHFASISLFYIIHFRVLNHSTTYIVQTLVLFSVALFVGIYYSKNVSVSNKSDVVLQKYF